MIRPKEYQIIGRPIWGQGTQRVRGVVLGYDDETVAVRLAAPAETYVSYYTWQRRGISWGFL
jgi:hypothetical protein